MTTRILTGHVMDKLAELPDESVHCVVTSPPYFGLRSYGTEPQVWGGELNCDHQWGDERLIMRSGGTGASTLSRHPDQSNQERAVSAATVASAGAFCRHCTAWCGSLGLEPSPVLYIAHLVEVFREVRRVLRKDGTFWLNIGDSYCNSDKWGGGGANTGKHTREPDGTPASWKAVRRKWSGLDGIKPKDLLGIPWMLAFALRADGWWLRSEIIWAKKAPMPESVTDRPTSATEKVFLLTKSARYFWDAEAVKEEAESDPLDVRRGNGAAYAACSRTYSATHSGAPGGKRNMRNWWLLGPEPFPEAHFATFPTEIPRKAILAGTSERGVCPKCGAPWERLVTTERVKHKQTPGQAGGGRQFCEDGGAVSEKSMFRTGLVPVSKTIGWHRTCSCDAEPPTPATVLDPFLGAGTTALVADQLGRDCIGIELNSSYAKMAENRLRDDAGMFVSIAAE